MAIATVSLRSSSASSPWTTAVSRAGDRRRRRGIRCSASRSLTEQYRTLQIQPGASEKEVKKAFRQLALQYHPDVCKGRDCGVQFYRINEAYDIVMSNLRAEAEVEEEEEEEGVVDDSSWEMWEEWMGWEGAGIRDYSSHINPYI